jgi:hypothetical protein
LDQTGYIVDLRLFSGGTTANASATINSGYIREITLNNDGSGYTSTPTVAISTAPSGGTNATAVAITTTRNSITSIKEILITNAGAGYTIAPTITISGGGGTGAAATCGINTASKVLFLSLYLVVVLDIQQHQMYYLQHHLVE